MEVECIENTQIVHKEETEKRRQVIRLQLTATLVCKR